MTGNDEAPFSIYGQFQQCVRDYRGLNAASENYLETVQSLLERFGRVAEQTHLARILPSWAQHSGETLAELATADASLGSVSFYLGQLCLQLTVRDAATSARATLHRHRLAQLEKAKSHFVDFVRLCECLRVLKDNEQEQIPWEKYTGDCKENQESTVTSDPSRARQEKIARFQSRKALELVVQEREQTLSQNRASLKNLEIDQDLEEEEREHLQLVLSLQLYQALDELDSIQQESALLLGFLEHHSAEEMPRIAQHHVSDETTCIDQLRSRQSNWKGPLLNESGKPLRPFVITNQRQDIVQGVFRPGHNLPSMTIEEYLKREFARGNVITGGGKLPEPKPVIDDEDELGLNQETMKLRIMDAFKEGYPHTFDYFNFHLYSMLTSTPDQQPKPLGLLYILRKEGTRVRPFPLTGEILVGRDMDCEVRIQLNEVAGKHAKIYFDDGEMAFVENLSTFGTKLNGSYISSPVELKCGDIITVGERCFRFEYPTASNATDVAVTTPRSQAKMPASIQKIRGSQLSTPVTVLLAQERQTAPPSSQRRGGTPKSASKLASSEVVGVASKHATPTAMLKKTLIGTQSPGTAAKRPADVEEASHANFLPISESQPNEIMVQSALSVTANAEPASTSPIPLKFASLDDDRSATPISMESTGPSTESLLFSPKKTPKSDKKKTPIKVKTPTILSPRKGALFDLGSVSPEPVISDKSTVRLAKTPKTAMLQNLDNFMEDTVGKKKEAAEMSNPALPKPGTPKKAKSNPSTPVKKQTPIASKKVPTTAIADKIIAPLAAFSPLAVPRVMSSTDVASPVTASQSTPKRGTPGRNKIVAPATPVNNSKPNSVVVTSAKKSVKFGPALSPEIFDQKMPSSAPVKRGTPVKGAGTMDQTILRSLLKKTISVAEQESSQPVVQSAASFDGELEDLEMSPAVRNVGIPKVESTTVISEDVPMSACEALLPDICRSGLKTDARCATADNNIYIGVREIMKTPSAAPPPEWKGIREMMKTPIEPAPVNLDGVRELLKTPGEIALADFDGIDLMMKTPAACEQQPTSNVPADIAQKTPSTLQDTAAIISVFPLSSTKEELVDLRDKLIAPCSDIPTESPAVPTAHLRLAQLPLVESDAKTTEENWVGLRETFKSPKSLPEASLVGIKELIKTPKPAVEEKLDGLAKMLATPSAAVEAESVSNNCMDVVKEELPIVSQPEEEPNVVDETVGFLPEEPEFIVENTTNDVAKQQPIADGIHNAEEPQAKVEDGEQKDSPLPATRKTRSKSVSTKEVVEKKAAVVELTKTRGRKATMIHGVPVDEEQVVVLPKPKRGRRAAATAGTPIEPEVVVDQPKRGRCKQAHPEVSEENEAFAVANVAKKAIGRKKKATPPAEEVVVETRSMRSKNTKPLQETSVPELNVDEKKPKRGRGQAKKTAEQPQAVPSFGEPEEKENATRKTQASSTKTVVQRKRKAAESTEPVPNISARSLRKRA